MQTFPKLAVTARPARSSEPRGLDSIALVSLPKPTQPKKEQERTMLTKTRRFVLVAVVLATSVAGSSLGLSSAKASTSDVLALMKFEAVKTSMSRPTNSGAYYEADVEVASAATVGQEVASCVRAKTTATCNVAFANANGIMDGHFTVNLKTGALTGTVTGGTGPYAHASGTLNGTRTYAGETLTVVWSPCKLCN
jgi:hypothetical protein